MRARCTNPHGPICSARGDEHGQHRQARRWASASPLSRRTRQGARTPFNRKIDAQNWLDSVTTAMQTGVYVDPNRGKITIGDWSARWLDGQAHLKPSTHERYAGILREHVLPQRSAVQLIDVTHADVQAPVSGLAGRRRCARFIASFHSSSRRPSGTVDWRGIRQRRSTCRGSSPPSADISRTSRCMHWPRR